MAKASSPIRLQKELMQAAELTAGRYHRSTAEQIEYWAELGRSVSSTLNPDVLLSIQVGLSRLNVEPVLAQPIDPDVVFNTLEVQRHNQTLSAGVSESRPRYQASLTHPGYLERIDQQGEVAVGQFKDGQFIPIDENERK
ncbi:MAG: ParD-like family protein [Porticoccaceae bacterium]|nr:ParD-like family protein [Porticoccaceae bacterium]